MCCFHCFKPGTRLSIEAVGEQETIRLFISPPYPSTKLMELAQPKSLCCFYHNNCRVRDINAHFNNRCCYQDCKVSVSKLLQYSIFFFAFLFAMQEPEFQIRINIATQMHVFLIDC